MGNPIPDWLSDSFSALVSSAQSNRLPHALLLVGRAGDGADLLAQQLADFLLCQNPGTVACGQCKACQLQRSQTHPDFLLVEPEGKSQTIKVDAVRRIIAVTAETAQQGARKVVYLKAADTMNTNAANALLKVLEEPTPETFIILTVSELSTTLPTIRSRCRLVQLPRPSMAAATAYLATEDYALDASLALAMTAGAPLDALAVTESEIAVWQENETQFGLPTSFIVLSQYIAKQELTTVLEQLLFWLDVAIRQQNGQSVLAPVSERLLQSLQALPAETLFRFRDYLVETLSAFRRQANLNNQLVAEELASKWIRLRGNQ